MEYRILGRTGLRAGVIGLGAEHLEFAPRETVVEVVHEALDNGVNYIDLFMGSPDVRDNFGRALGGRTEEVLIAGHLGAVWNGQYLKSRDKNLCEDFIHDLLRRVKIDALGLLMLHYVDEPDDCEAILSANGLIETALRLKEQGKVRFLGASSHMAPAARRLVESGMIDVLMFPVNPMFDRLPGALVFESMWQQSPYEQLRAGALHEERDGLYRACAAAGVGLVAMKVYAGSWLLKQDNPLGAAMTPAQCLSYALSRPGVTCAVPGCRTAAEMRAALSYLEADTAGRDFSAVAASSLIRAPGCMYCNHCLPCPAGIDVAAVMRLLDAAAGGPTAQIQREYAALSAKAADCTGCGVCRERCPFGFDAPAAMRRAADVFSPPRIE